MRAVQRSQRQTRTRLIDQTIPDMAMGRRTVSEQRVPVKFLFFPDRLQYMSRSEKLYRVFTMPFLHVHLLPVALAPPRPAPPPTGGTISAAIPRQLGQ